MQLQLPMSKFEDMSHKKAQKAQMVKKSRLAFCAFCAFLWLIVCVGCRRDMQDQPKIKPLRGTSFFAMDSEPAADRRNDSAWYLRTIPSTTPARKQRPAQPPRAHPQPTSRGAHTAKHIS
jgi:hypothetical protein